MLNLLLFCNRDLPNAVNTKEVKVFHASSLQLSQNSAEDVVLDTAAYYTADLRILLHIASVFQIWNNTSLRQFYYIPLFITELFSI